MVCLFQKQITSHFLCMRYFPQLSYSIIFPNFHPKNPVFPKIIVPQNGWFIIENPIKMDDLELLMGAKIQRSPPGIVVPKDPVAPLRIAWRCGDRFFWGILPLSWGHIEHMWFVSKKAGKHVTCVGLNVVGYILPLKDMNIRSNMCRYGRVNQ